MSGAPTSHTACGHPAHTKDTHCPTATPAYEPAAPSRSQAGVEGVLDSAQGTPASCINPKPGPTPGTTASAACAWRIATCPPQHNEPTQQTPKHALHKSYVQHKYSARSLAASTAPSDTVAASTT